MRWFRSSRCADSACVEVAKIGDGFVGLRDSKRPEQPFLRFQQAEWSAFIDALKADHFSVS